MEPEKVFQMPFSNVYPLLVNKAVRKGRSQAEVDAVIAWLTGYDQATIHQLADSPIAYGAFFTQAPAMNPARKEIRGTICGLRVETIQDPLMRDIRCLDKLVDALAKGRPLENILGLDRSAAPAAGAEK